MMGMNDFSRHLNGQDFLVDLSTLRLQSCNLNSIANEKNKNENKN
jgi:hypothetical protein